MEPILKIRNLSIDYKVNNGTLRACDNVSLDIYKGDIVGIIGESGSGKSTLASGILKTIKSPGEISEGQIIYCDKEDKEIDLLKLTEEEYAKYRWSNITTVFQAAQNVLNPTLKIKEHFLETAWAHNNKLTKHEILDKTKELLKNVRLEERVLDSYPHQLSGGMKQRTIIALSLLLSPDILILDEPTTALDVITQWYIMDILRKVHEEMGITMIFLTHDVSVIGSIVDRLGVMYAGELVEYGMVEDIFKKPTHPYTYGLMHAIPSLHDDVSKRKAIPGYPPNLLELPDSCRFAPRCYLYKDGICDGDSKKTDKLYTSGPDQLTRCYMWEKVNKICR
ncbi:ABC transporter ATP-binding protein [Vallitalea longa]|uniref:ABC transporter ATP-binding protein n=1 Tax=Vallitalea longa TaxID=2936439 RepID=A0A9W6DEP2_9FIRM|nr:ABC transporter ATP-binding protein [Vallitalea longa]GKX29730.1 ABC transporter ATP-binding protein [Vallitalea longa]